MRKSLLALAVSSAGGYLLTLALSPILTRLYSPESFGLFGIFGSIVAIFSILATLSLELGILGSKRRTDGLRFASSSVILAVLFALAGALVSLALLQGAITSPLPLWAVGGAFLASLVSSLQVVSVNWTIRCDNAVRAARATFVGLAGRAILQVVFGMVFGGLSGLVLGEVVGRVFGWLTAGTGIARAALRRLRKSPGRIFNQVRQNLDYPTFVTPSVLIEVALVWLPTPMLALAYGPAAGGYFALVQRLGSAPLTIINQSLGQAVHRYAGDFLETGKSRVVRFCIFLALGSLPFAIAIMTLIWFYGTQFAGAIFGAEWREAGLVAFIFLPLFYVQFLSLVTNRIMLVMRWMRFKLFAAILHVVMLGSSLLIAKAVGMDWLGAMTIQSALLTLSHFLVFVAVLLLVSRWKPPAQPA